MKGILIFILALINVTCILAKDLVKVVSPEDKEWRKEILSLIDSCSIHSDIDTLTVYFSSGFYEVDRTIELSNKEWEKTDIVIRFIGLGKVCFSGAYKLDNKLFTPISSSDIKGRIIDKDKIRYIKEFTLPDELDLGEISCIGFARNSKVAPPMLYFNTKRMTLSRYPNEPVNDADLADRKAVIKIDKIIDPGMDKQGLPMDRKNETKSYSGEFECNDDRIKKWIYAEDLWVDGIFSRDWAWSYNKIARLDTLKKSIRLQYPEKYDLTSTASFFFVSNILEEIDNPGEYYIDRKNRKLYFYPPCEDKDFLDAEISMSVISSPFIKIDGLSGLLIENIEFEYGRSSAIQLKNVDNSLVSNCCISNFGGRAIDIYGNNNKVIKCKITSIGETAIDIKGGNLLNQDSGNNIVQNCDVSDWAFYNRVYTPAVKLSGYNHKVYDNKFYDAPHGVITLSGQDHTIEGNEIYNVLLEFADFGAIYAFVGATQEMRGYKVLNNYFHDIGLHGHRVNAVYVDECSADWLISGNLFYNIGSPGKRVSAIQANTGYHIRVENNTFIDCSQTFELSFHFTTWGWSRYEKFFKPRWDKNYMSKDVIPEHYLKHYKELGDFHKEDKIWTNTCTFINNEVGNFKMPLKHKDKFFTTLSSDTAYSEKLIKSYGNVWLNN